MTDTSKEAVGRSRDWIADFAHENGNYACVCRECEKPFYGHKRRTTCRDCAEVALLHLCKQPAALAAKCDALQARVAELENKLKIIANWKADCHAYDSENGHELRVFDHDDVSALTFLARQALSTKENQDD